MKYLQTYNERLGINKDVLETSKEIMKFIKNNFLILEKEELEYDIERWDDWMFGKMEKSDWKPTVNKFIIEYKPKLYKRKYKLTGQMQYYIDKNMHNKNISGLCFKLVFTQKNVNLSTIIHEIQHMYEDIKKFNPIEGIVYENDKAREWAYGYSRKRQIDSNINKFFTSVYFSQDNEINSRIQDTYIELKEELEKEGILDKVRKFKKDKQNIEKIQIFNKLFIGLIKLTYSYKMSQGLQKNFLQNYLKNPKKAKKLVNKLKLLKKYDLWTSSETESDKYDFIGYAIEFFYKNIIPSLKNVISEEESVKFLKYYNDFFMKQGKKLEKKLFKLYDLFIDEEL